MQDILGDYDGTVLLVSHDRDFIDRVATTTVALEGRGPGHGLSRRLVRLCRAAWASPPPNAMRARPPARCAAATRPGAKPAAAPLTFTERKRLDDLPAQIARLEAEIAKLSEFLSDDAFLARAGKVPQGHRAWPNVRPRLPPPKRTGWRSKKRRRPDRCRLATFPF